MKAIALESYQYPEYKQPNWIKGRQYDATDDGYLLTMTSETGNFYFAGPARQAVLTMFQFDNGNQSAGFQLQISGC